MAEIQGPIEHRMSSGLSSNQTTFCMEMMAAICDPAMPGDGMGYPRLDSVTMQLSRKEMVIRECRE